MRIRPGLRPSVRAVTFLGGQALLCAHLLGGCGQTVEVGIDDALSTAAASGSGGALSVAGSGTSDAGDATSQAGAPACVKIECRGKFYECGDCIDNDQDGAADALDPECLGPCDNDESGLSTGMTASTTAACRQDCYFDGDSGPGNDQCTWSHFCDPLSVAPDYPPSGEVRCEHDPGGQVMGVACDTLQVEQEPSCLDSCLPLVPNGCDCFGCCKLPDGFYHFVGRGRGEAGCQLDALDDVDACPLCTPVEGCLNPCEDCEACVGRPPPAGCNPEDACPPGQAACTTDAPCDFAEYCVTGCCVRPPEPI